MSTFWLDYFQIWGKSPKLIWRIWWVLFRSYFLQKIFALQCSAYSVNWCKCPILIGKIQQMSTFWIDYFQIWGKFPQSISRMWWVLFRSSIPINNICSPMQCFFCKLVQRSNFGRLKSANGHFWINYFQIWGKSLKSIWRMWWVLFRSSITPQKDLLSTAVLFLQIGANVQFWSVIFRKWAHFVYIICKPEAYPQKQTLLYGGN